MLISCNRLKSYIQNSNKIDWIKIWETFTIRTAEVESVTVKGNDLKEVVCAEILECEKHSTKENYYILKVTDGNDNYDILCGAPNVRVGLKAPLVKVGGMVKGFTIAEKKIAGVVSQGMLCAGDELGINDYHTGIVELPADSVLGVDIKDILPIEDIIVEIDNKSLTNRPDLWGHYGIAREIAAISKKQLLPLEIMEIENSQNDLNITIKNPELSYRYCGLTIDNIQNHKTPLEMQIFLYYTGMRSISLIVDLTNYLLLELGQPMHAFDKKIVKAIQVELAKDKDKFVTLDGVERTLTKETLMIKNANEYSAIAGIMGGLDSEIKENTQAIFLESAIFDATNIRKSATALGLRTEASARYEKSLDPNMSDLAMKRFVKLLKEIDKNIIISSNLTDVYPKPLKAKKVELEKVLLTKYLGFEMSDTEVEKILTSLSFEVKTLKDSYEVLVPTYRATKDISMGVDLIEEIARIYGYENFAEVPLKLDLTFVEHENIFTEEYKVKDYLASKYKLNEVHSYLWYDTELLKTLNIEKENIKLVGKTENNILRDNLSLSLLKIVKENFKHENEVNIFEIGTVIKNKENRRSLSIILAAEEKELKDLYYKAKRIVSDIFATFKNLPVNFQEKTKAVIYEFEEEIVVGKVIGNIAILSSFLTNKIAKKKVLVMVEIDFDKYLALTSEKSTYKPVNKYQENCLDYTIIMDKKKKYQDLEKIIKQFTNEYILSYKLVGTYEDKEYNKYTIRYKVGSLTKTLSSKDLHNFKDSFLEHIKKNELQIIL